MPLTPPPTQRELLHTRAVTCHGYKRDDGLWDIEATLKDTKSYAFDNRYRGTVQPGEPVHEMWLRLTVDQDLKIHAVEAVTDQGPFPVCPAITPNFQRLVGLRILPGWNKRVRGLLGGVDGCTHLVELLGPLATTAYQTIWSRRGNEAKDTDKRPAILDSCHALKSDGSVVKDIWPRFYRGDA